MNLKETIDSWKGRYVIIRTYAAGVHFGMLDDYDPITRHVLLKNSRRIWCWEGSFTLSNVAIDGVKSAKVPKFLDEIIIMEVIEIIPTSEKSTKCFLSLEENKI